MIHVFYHSAVFIFFAIVGIIMIAVVHGSRENRTATILDGIGLICLVIIWVAFYAYIGHLVYR